MVVDGKRHTKDLILLPDRVISNWWREMGHRLSAGDLEEVLLAQVEVLVIGTGALGLMQVDEATRFALRTAGVEARIAETDRAWRLYNDVRERRSAAGAFHLTC
jgi:hypothetical protein